MKLDNNDDSSGVPSVAHPETTEEAYWRGFRACLDEQTRVVPEPANPTLWRYLDNALKKDIIYHSLGVNRRPDGGMDFYIHPTAIDGETEDYLLWPDPFNWSDMIVNKKDSPPPDVEKFKAYLAKQFPSK